MKKRLSFLFTVFLLCFISGCKQVDLVEGSLKWNPEGNLQYLDSTMALDISDSVFTVSYSGNLGTSAALKDYVSFSSEKDSSSETDSVLSQIKFSFDEEKLKIQIDTKSVTASKPVFCKMKIKDDFSEWTYTVSVSKPDHNASKKLTAVISDIHLTDERAKHFGYNLLKENKTKLLHYLSYLKENASSYKELILLGDIIDEFSTGLYVPGTVEKISLFPEVNGKPVSQAEYEQMIADFNKDVIAAVKAVGEAGVQLVYVPGNHDQYVSAESITQIFGEDIKQVRDADNPLLGLYTPDSFSNVIMEHGSRYDVINALDCSAEGMNVQEGETPTLSIGYFLTRGITQIRMPALASSISFLQALMGGSKKDQSMEERLKNIQDSISDEDERNYRLTIAFIKDYIGGISKNMITTIVKEIDTGIGGIKGTYKVADLLPALSKGDSEQIYFQDLTKQEAWEKRLKYNKVPETLPFIDGLLGPSTDYGMINVLNHVFGNDPEHNIFIMGHTHRPSLFVRKAEGGDHNFIYANSGSWVNYPGNHDDGTPYEQCSFIELYEDDGMQQISLKHVDKNLSFENLEYPVWLLN